MNPNLEQAARFLTALTGEVDPVVTFQTFDDNDQRKDRSLAQHPHGTLSQLSEHLTELNQRGAGVFAMVAEGDGQGRTNANVFRARAVFVDLDGAPVGPVESNRTPPHIVVESSPGKFHAYWLTRDLPLQDFGLVQKALAERFNSDPSVNDLARVLRVPGYWHCKGTPFQSRIVRIAADLTPIPARILPRIEQASFAAPLPARIPSPGRHESLMRLAGKLRAHSVCREGVVACLRAVNLHQCDPPLTGARATSEIEKIADWAMRREVRSPLGEPSMPDYSEEELKAAAEILLTRKGVGQ